MPKKAIDMLRFWRGFYGHHNSSMIWNAVLFSLFRLFGDYLEYEIVGNLMELIFL